MFLSIIIPVYNTKPQFIKECLESIESIKIPETYEVVVVNDGSKNEETLHYLQTLDTNKYTIVHKENGGLGSARNAGIKVSKGKYIFPLDSDDLLNDDFNLFLTTLKNSPSIDILYGDLKIFGDEEKIIRYPEFNLFKMWFDENIIQGLSFYKKEVWEKVGGYDESFKTIEDYDFWVRCTLKGIEFKHIPFCAFKYRVINNGESMIQYTKHIIGDHLITMRNKIPASLITKEVMNDYVIYTFKNKKRKAIGLLLYVYTPGFYNFLTKLKLFSYKDKFI